MCPWGCALKLKGRHGVFAGKTVWSMPERFEIYIVYKRRYINTLPFPKMSRSNGSLDNSNRKRRSSRSSASVSSIHDERCRISSLFILSVALIDVASNRFSPSFTPRAASRLLTDSRSSEVRCLLGCTFNNRPPRSEVLWQLLRTYGRKPLSCEPFRFFVGMWAARSPVKRKQPGLAQSSRADDDDGDDVQRFIRVRFISGRRRRDRRRHDERRRRQQDVRWCGGCGGWWRSLRWTQLARTFPVHRRHRRHRYDRHTSLW